MWAWFIPNPTLPCVQCVVKNAKKIITENSQQSHQLNPYAIEPYHSVEDLDGDVQQHVVALLVRQVGDVLGVGQGAGNILRCLNTTELNQTSTGLLE